mgnify:FL=1
MRGLDPEGNPIQPNLCKAFRSENRSSSGGSERLRCADGAHLLAHQESPSMEGRFFVAAQDQKYGKIEAEYRPGSTKEVVLSFAAPGFLDFAISGFSPAAHHGVYKVSLVPESENPRHHYSNDALSAEGKARLGPVQPGRYVLAVLVAVDDHWALPGSRTPVDLHSGDQALSLPRPETHPLRLRWAEGAGKQVTVQLAMEGVVAVHRTFDKEGVVSFSHLPAGRYKVRTYGGEQKTLDVDLPGPATVEIR